MGFVGLYTGASGIRAAQMGLDTAANNIANANTPGYTRQRVELKAGHTYNSPSGPVGTGVTVDSVARLRDQFLDDRFRAAIGRGAEDTVRAEFLQSMETLSGEPDQGISSRIGQLWGVLEGWTNNPDSDAARGEVLGTMVLVAEGFRATADSWDRLGEDTAERLETAIDTANALMVEIDAINRLTANAHDARVGPQTFDQRDLLVDQLAELTGATARNEPNGTVRITLGDTVLVDLSEDADPRGFATLRLDGDQVQVSALDSELADTADDGAFTVDTGALSGELRGLQQVLAEDLPRRRDELDDVARQLAEAFNRVNAAGVDRNGDTGGDLFEFEPGNEAASLQVISRDPNVLAAAQTVDPDDPPDVHDGSNARAFTELRSARLDPDGVPDAAGGRSIENSLADLIVGLATDVNSARSRADAALGIATGAQLSRASEHGVSIDEEMVSLIRYQRALEAAARVMTTVDQALDTLVNRVGIVGR